MWDILHMRVTSLVAVVLPRTGKTVKNGSHVAMFLKEEKICYKMVSTLCIYVKPIVRNRVAKEFK